MLLAALLAANLIFIAARWPYAPARVVEGLERGTATELRFGYFQPTFFPKPGCVLRDVTFARGLVQLATVRTLKLEGSWSDVLTLRRRTDRIRVEGAHVRIGSGSV
jgi:hypothetical protein